MVKIKKILHRDSYDWESLTKNIVGNGTYFKINNYIGIVLNIAIPMILLFIFKVNISTFIICFVLFDIFQVILEKFSIFIFTFFKGFLWLTKKKQYEEKISSMSPYEIENYKKELSSTHSFYNEKLKIINEKIEEYKSFDKIMTPNTNKDDISYVEEMILKLKQTNHPKWINASLKRIVELSENLLSIVKEDNESIVIIINTYNIYSEELLKIIVQYEDMDKEQKEKYRPKLEELFDIFYSHLLSLQEKIQRYKESSIDFDISFLAKKIRGDENVSE